MANNRKEHLRYRYGICLNDSCSKCKSKEVQQIPARKDLECEECHKPLRECPPPRSFWKKYGKIIIGAAVAIIAAIIIVLCFNTESGPEKKPIDDSGQTEQTPVSGGQNANDSTNEATKTDSLKTDTLKITDSKELGNTDEVTKPKGGQKPKPTEPIAQSGTKKLSYGTWTGTLKNGEPHGQGTLTYSTEKVIDSRDPKGRVAHPSEYIIGEWENGHLVQGRWFKKDGTKEVIIIGKVG